jgi:hypothetical protein
MTPTERIGVTVGAALAALRDVLPDLALLVGILASISVIVTAIANTVVNRRNLALAEERAEREKAAHEAGLKVRGEDRRKTP